ncbi:hypothetical protein LIA77_10612 [Sarocladium implicatum]|nr:hypothetical protein LIA77_10612 [Sarocladium implicatum]
MQGREMTVEGLGGNKDRDCIVGIKGLRTVANSDAVQPASVLVASSGRSWVNRLRLMRILRFGRLHLGGGEVDRHHGMLR